LPVLRGKFPTLKTVAVGIRDDLTQTIDHYYPQTIEYAAKQGGHLFVIGRPITEDQDPVKAAQKYHKRVLAALS